ncbi:hypothetical protein Ancab_033443 [Ancistrocladus abbreviatus]
MCWGYSQVQAHGKISHPSLHPEFPTYHPLETPIAHIPPTSHYLTEAPMLPEDLGMGMALTSNPCGLILVVLVMMTGLALPECIGFKFYLGLHQNFLAPIVGFQDEHLVTQILDIGKTKVDGQLPFEQIISQLEDSRQKKLNSDDIVVKNPRQLDMDNSSLDGPSINSNDVEHRRREKDDVLDLLLLYGYFVNVIRIGTAFAKGNFPLLLLLVMLLPSAIYFVCFYYQQ